MDLRWAAMVGYQVLVQVPAKDGQLPPTLPGIMLQHVVQRKQLRRGLAPKSVDAPF